MSNIIELIKQDLDVANSYLDKNKFEIINIIGNRILQNLFAINRKELMISGLALKEISFDLQQIKAADSKSHKNVSLSP